MAVKEATLILSLPFFIVRRRSFPPFLDNFPINNFNSTFFPLSLLPIKGENKDNQLYFAVIQLVQVAPALFPCSHSFRQPRKTEREEVQGYRHAENSCCSPREGQTADATRDALSSPLAVVPGLLPLVAVSLCLSRSAGWYLIFFPGRAEEGRGYPPQTVIRGLTTQGGGSRGSGN